MRKYPSDLTDRQWQVMEKTLCSKRKRRNPLRAVINALLYITKSGCQWRMLPKEYPLWQSVYYYFRKWKRDGTLEEVHDTLASDIRKGKAKKDFKAKTDLIKLFFFQLIFSLWESIVMCLKIH
jgi:putative transposase